jgi:hypothetical protein
MTNNRVSIRLLSTILVLSFALLAASSATVTAKQAHKAKHRWVWSYYGQHYSADSHYGQRACSVSVGNPAFPNRLAHWPNRWND